MKTFRVSQGSFCKLINSSSISLNDYLNEVSRIPLLSLEEEQSLLDMLTIYKIEKENLEEKLEEKSERMNNNESSLPAGILQQSDDTHVTVLDPDPGPDHHMPDPDYKSELEHKPGLEEELQQQNLALGHEEELGLGQEPGAGVGKETASPYPILSEDEIKSLLVRHNLRFVISVAKYYKSNSNVELEDLISEGNTGLLEAVEKYDPRYGVRFITFAVYYIRNNIIQSLPSITSQIRLPINIFIGKSQIEKIKSVFLLGENREPSLEEIKRYGTKQMGISSYFIEKSYSIGCDTISSRIGGGQLANNQEDTINDDDYVTSIASKDYYDYKHSEYSLDRRIDSKQSSILIDKALSTLKPKEQTVVKLLLGFSGREYNVDEIASLLSVSVARIKQIYRNAILKLQNNRFAKAILKDLYFDK